MTDRDRIINQVKGMVSKALFILGAKEVAHHDDNAVSIPYNGYTVKIHIDVKIQRKKKKAN